MKLSRVMSEPGFCAGTFGNVVMVEWRERPRKEAIDAISKMLDDLIQSEKGKVAFLAVASLSVGPPDTTARDAFADTMARHADRLAGSVLVIESTGLRSAALRAVASAISLLGGAGSMPQPFATVKEAAEHLANILSASKASAPEPRALVEALKELRAHAPTAARTTR